MGNITRNAHPKTVENLDMNVGQWSFCKNCKDLEYINNFVISFLFLIQHNRILSRLVVYKKAFDIRRARRSVVRHQPLPQNHKNTNHRVYLFFIIFVKLFEYYYLFLFFYLSIIIYCYSFNYWVLYNYTPYDLYFCDFGEGVGVGRRCVICDWCQMLF